MKIQIDRYLYGEKSTIGKVSVEINGVMVSDLCHSLEPKVRAKKIKGITAIPAGTYKVIMRYSVNWKKNMPFLLDVPNFQGIMIHPGNSSKDTQGCILVGEFVSENWVKNSRKNFSVIESSIKAALLAGDEVTITINNSPPKPPRREGM